MDSIETFEEAEGTIEDLIIILDQIYTAKETLRELVPEGQELYDALVEFDQWHEIDIPSSAHEVFGK